MVKHRETRTNVMVPTTELAHALDRAVALGVIRGWEITETDSVFMRVRHVWVDFPDGTRTDWTVGFALAFAVGVQLTAEALA